MKERKTKLCVFIILSATVSLPFLCFPLKCKLERWCVLSRLFERQERVRSGVNGALDPSCFAALPVAAPVSAIISTMIVFLRLRSLFRTQFEFIFELRTLCVCCLSDDIHFSKAQIVWASLYASITNCTSFCDFMFKFNPGLRSLHVSEVCDTNPHIKGKMNTCGRPHRKHLWWSGFFHNSSAPKSIITVIYGPSVAFGCRNAFYFMFMSFFMLILFILCLWNVW